MRGTRTRPSIWISTTCPPASRGTGSISRSLRSRRTRNSSLNSKESDSPGNFTWDYHEVETDTPFQWNDENFYANYGGINKNVYLHVTDPLYQTLPLYSSLNTTGLYVYATDIDVSGKSATITAEAQVRNEYDTAKKFTYQAEITDLNGTKVKTINGDEYTLDANETTTVSVLAELSNLEFWSWGYGYLYDVHTSLSVDGTPLDKVNGVPKDRIQRRHVRAERSDLAPQGVCPTYH